MITLDDVVAARSRIEALIARTPLVQSRTISERLGTNAYLKLEMFQKTGSFKPRGAFNQVLGFTDRQRAAGVIGVSGGNFAQGLAFACRELGVACHIAMPQFTPSNYVEATKAYGAEVTLTATLAEAFDMVEKEGARGMTSAHPFDNPNMMAGNGTVGLEILDDMPQVTDVLVSIGGGGFMTGVATALKANKPEVRIWGVETEGADAMHRALEKGEISTMEPTSIAKTLGAPFVSEDTLAAASAYLEGVTVVSDRDAYRELRFILERVKVLTEPAASCTLAAASQLAERFQPDDHVLLILCGGNSSVADIAAWEERFS